MSSQLVTHVLWSLGRAGAERVVLDLAKRLPAKGFDVRVVAAGGGGDMIKDYKDANVTFVIGPETRDRLATLRFIHHELKTNRPNILHTHLGADVWAGIEALRLSLHPWIATVHNDDPDDPWLRHVARGIAYRHADNIVCVSRTVAQYVAREFDVRSDKLTVIRNGVDLNRIIMRGSQRFQDVPRLVTVGRLSPQKDHATLIRALALVKRPWRLDVFGEGPLRQSLGHLAEQHGISSHIRFCGITDKLAYELSRADVFCFPSRWEGQGLALIEAAAAGLPCIASDLPVFREIFNSQHLSFATPGDERAWANAISDVLNDPIASLHRAALARQIVEQCLTVEQMVEGYIEIYKKQLLLCA